MTTDKEKGCHVTDSPLISADFRIEFIKYKSQYRRCCGTGNLYRRPVSLCIPVTLKWIIHRYYGEPIDLQRIGSQNWAKKGVLALMCDTTNALRPGFTMSERTVGATFDKIFTDNKNSRLIIATFASNVDRVQQIINSAVKYGRKVCR